MEYPKIRPDLPAPDPDLVRVAIRGAKNKRTEDYRTKKDNKMEK